MAIAHVQTMVVNSDGDTSITSSALTTSTGNLIVAATGSWQSGVQNACVVTDSKSNTWTEVGNSPQNPSANTRHQLFYAKNISGGGSHTFTCTTQSGGIFITMFVMEISGLDTVNPYDSGAAAGATGSSTSASSGSTGTRSQADSIIIGALGTGDNVNGGTLTAGSGFTIPTNGSQNSFSNFVSAIEYQIVNTVGTDAATFTLSNDAWGCIAAVFKAPGVATLPPQSRFGRQAAIRASYY